MLCFKAIGSICWFRFCWCFLAVNYAADVNVVEGCFSFLFFCMVGSLKKVYFYRGGEKSCYLYVGWDI